MPMPPLLLYWTSILPPLLLRHFWRLSQSPHLSYVSPILLCPAWILLLNLIRKPLLLLINRRSIRLPLLKMYYLFRLSLEVCSSSRNYSHAKSVKLPDRCHHRCISGT